MVMHGTEVVRVMHHGHCINLFYILFPERTNADGDVFCYSITNFTEVLNLCMA